MLIILVTVACAVIVVYVRDVSVCVVGVRKAMYSRMPCSTPPSMLRSLTKALMEKRESVFVMLTLH